MTPPPPWPSWIRPGARPGRMEPRLPPPYGSKTSLFPPRGYCARFSPSPRPPPLPHGCPVVDTEQIWLASFKRTHCCAQDRSHSPENGRKEPPLRRLRRQILQTRTLVAQLQAAAMELASVETKREMRRTSSGENGVDDQRLHVQYERQLGVCEALKQQLEAMNATSGLFPIQQLNEIREFASRVNKKKAYRKRAKLRRRADARIRRARNLNSRQVENIMGRGEVESKIFENDEPVEEKAVSCFSKHVVHTQKTVTCVTANERNSSKKSLDSETLTLDALITVRRAWDAFIVFPATLGASTIPPHFVPPPSAPSVQWAKYVASPPIQVLEASI